MRKLLFAGSALFLALAACSEGSPLAPVSGAFDFEILAPRQIDTKSVLEIEARITNIDRARYPLTFVFEKANAGQAFVGAGEVVLVSPGERVARVQIPILMDPAIRVTVSESSDSRVTVSKTVRIDVLDF